MKFTSTLGLLFLISGFVHAKKLNQCQEIETQLAYANCRIHCENNEEGKIDNLTIVFLQGKMSDEDFATVKSYDTITKLQYLPVDYGYIKAGTFKELKNLKHLDVSSVNLSQENIDEISTLVNLEALALDFCSFENVKDFSSLSNLKNIQFLSSLQNINGHYRSLSQTPYHDVPSEFIYQFKNVKDLNINSCSTVDLKQFNDVESLWIGHVENISSLKNVKNLRNLRTPPDNDLSVLEHIESLDGIEIYNEYSISDPDEISYKTTNFALSENSKIRYFSLEGIKVTNENVENILKLNDLYFLNFINCDFSSLSDENILKLKELEKYNIIDWDDPTST